MRKSTRFSARPVRWMPFGSTWCALRRHSRGTCRPRDRGVAPHQCVRPIGPHRWLTCRDRVLQLHPRGSRRVPCARRYRLGRHSIRVAALDAVRREDPAGDRAARRAFCGRSTTCSPNVNPPIVQGWCSTARALAPRQARGTSSGAGPPSSTTSASIGAVGRHAVCRQVAARTPRRWSDHRRCRVRDVCLDRRVSEPSGGRA